MDYKGNVTDALSKLIGDLRKFGYSNAKNLKPDQLKGGWGETICAVVDELLNLELYRREFQFKEVFKRHFNQTNWTLAINMLISVRD